MKSHLIKVLLFILTIGCAFSVSAGEENGDAPAEKKSAYSVGVTGGFAPRIIEPGMRFMVGAFGAYQYNFNNRLFFKPQVGLSYNQFLGGYLSGGQTGPKVPFYLSLDLTAHGGVNIGNRWSFITGPEIKTIFAQGKGLYVYPFSLYWNIGFSRQYGRCDVAIIYNQHMTPLRQTHGNAVNNAFNLSIGYRF